MANRPTYAKNPKNPSFDYVKAIPFIILHLSCFAAIWTGFTKTAVILFFVLFFSRIFFATAIYHRYFSHKSYETSRVFQFILAFLAETCAQQGVIWWANHHRRHHKHSDTPQDVHTPRHQGFWYSHIGWIFSPEYTAHDYDMVQDWQRYPELVFLDKYHYIPSIALGVVAWLIGGWSGLVVGFCWSTVAVYQSTFSINSLTHVFGTQRYITADDSRNNLWLALLTFGEGWHNNHHFCSTSVRQGFFWWEIDISYYLIVAMSKVGLVWNLKQPPAEVLQGTARVPRKIMERSQELVTEASCNLDGYTSHLMELKTKISHLIEQPALSVAAASHEICVTLEQLAHSLKEKTKAAEYLPPKLAHLMKEKFHHAAGYVENAIQSLKLKESFKAALDALDSALHSLEFKEIKVTGV